MNASKIRTWKPVPLPLDFQLALESGNWAKALKVYQFNTKVAKHFFCSHCGIYTHHQRRSYPDQYGYNVGCLEGINPFDLEPVPLLDGVNHPADRNA